MCIETVRGGSVSKLSAPSGPKLITVSALSNTGDSK
jgi:hypothetical protein